MEIIRFLLLLCLFQSSVFAQTKFFRSYTNNGYDFGEGIIEHPDGGYVVTGSSSSFLDAPAQAFILRVDAAGEFMWSRDFGGDESDWGRRIFLHDNHYYVAGYTNSIGAGSFDFYFVKTDTTGAVIWEKTYGSSAFEKLNSAAQLADGSFILVGETYNTISQNSDIYVVCVDPDGIELWSHQWGSAFTDYAKSIAVLDDQNIFIVGAHYDNTYQDQKAMILKIDHLGNQIFLKTYGDNGIYALNDVCIRDGFVYGVGYDHVSGQDPYLYRIKTDLGGTPYSESIEQNQGTNILECITTYGLADKFYVAAQVKDASYPSYPDGEDVVIIRYNQDLFFDNAHVYPSATGHDQANQFIPTSDGGAILVGYNTYLASGGNAAILVKIGPNDDFPTSHTLPQVGTLVHVGQISDKDVFYYPNPSQDYIQLEGLTGEYRYQIFTLEGSSVLVGTMSSDDHTIGLAGLKYGSYLVRVENAASILQFKITKVD